MKKTFDCSSLAGYSSKTMISFDFCSCRHFLICLFKGLMGRMMCEGDRMMCEGGKIDG